MATETPRISLDLQELMSKEQGNLNLDMSVSHGELQVCNTTSHQRCVSVVWRAHAMERAKEAMHRHVHNINGADS